MTDRNLFLPSLAATEVGKEKELNDAELASWYAFSNPKKPSKSISFRRDLPWWRYLMGTMPDAGVLFRSSTFFSIIDTTLRSYSQVLFMNNPITGAFYLAAYLASSPPIGLLSLLGACCANLTSLYLRQHPQTRQNGLFGYNGVLTGAALGLFQGAGSFDNFNESVLATVVVASVSTTIFQICLGQLLTARYGVATFTFAFHLATWTWLLVGQQALYLPNDTKFIYPNLVEPVTISGRAGMEIDEKRLFEGMALNIAQVFLLADWWVGVVVFIGTLFASRITAMMIVVGSVVASSFALGMGVNLELIYAGLLGFNGVVVMAAIAGMFWALSLRTFTFAVIGVIQSTVFTVALATFLSPVGLPALTFPAAFVCTIWTLINPVLHSSDSFFVTLDHMTIPEDHLRRLRVTHKIAGVLFSDQRTIAGSSKEMAEFESSIVPAVVCFYVAEGRLQTIRSWVESGVIDINKPDFDGRTPLHIAASVGQEKIVSFLLDSGAMVNPRDRYGNTPLEDAVREKQPEIIKLLRKKGGKLKLAKNSVGARLCENANNNDSDALFALLLAGIDPNTPDYDGRTALHLSVCSVNAPIVRRLLLSGASASAPIDCANHTPLEEAELILKNSKTQGGEKEKKKVVRMLKTPNAKLVQDQLVESGKVNWVKEEDAAKEKIDAKPGWGKGSNRNATVAFLQLGQGQFRASPLRRTGGSQPMKLGDDEEVEVLLDEEEVKVEEDEEETEGQWTKLLAGDKDFFTRLANKTKKASTFEEEAFQSLLINYVSACGFVEPLRSLLGRRGGLPIDYDKRTPLHVAASSGHEEVVRFLIYYGFPINPLDIWHHTPLLDAIMSGHDHVAALLYSLGGEILLSPCSQVQALVNCAIRHDSVGFEMRLKYGFDPNAVDYDGRTTLHCLLQKGVTRMWIDCLLAHGAQLDITDRWGVSVGEIMGQWEGSQPSLFASPTTPFIPDGSLSYTTSPVTRSLASPIPTGVGGSPTFAGRPITPKIRGGSSRNSFAGRPLSPNASIFQIGEPSQKLPQRRQSLGGGDSGSFHRRPSLGGGGGGGDSPPNFPSRQRRPSLGGGDSGSFHRRPSLGGNQPERKSPYRSPSRSISRQSPTQTEPFGKSPQFRSLPGSPQFRPIPESSGGLKGPLNRSRSWTGVEMENKKEAGDGFGGLEMPGEVGIVIEEQDVPLIFGKSE